MLIIGNGGDGDGDDGHFEFVFKRAPWSAVRLHGARQGLTLRDRTATGRRTQTRKRVALQLLIGNM
jgi:hypothetical protein